MSMSADRSIETTPAYHGHMTTADGSHLPLSAEQAFALWEQTERHIAERAAKLPDEQSAIRAMFEAFDRLRELGWSEIMYSPKDGSWFDVLEPGSTGIHRCHYVGEWPDGHWYGPDDEWYGRMRPMLFRLDPEAEAARKRKMEEAAAAYRLEREHDS
jgi:hypothetical protein